MSSSTVRQVLLGGVVFVAAFGVLLGLTAIVQPGRAPDASGSATTSAGTVVATPATTEPSPTPTAAPSGATAGSVAPSASAATVATLVGAGDIAGCDWDEDEATAALLDGIDGTVFTAGDNVYPAGRADTYAECFDPTWGRHLDRIRPAPGNHDWELGTLDAYRDYFGDAARNEDGDPWYAYALGSWQVIVLDSDCSRVGGCDPGSAQGRWLAETLAASDAVCTLAIWHHPRFSSGTHGNDATVAPFWDALYAAGADVVVNGHEHDYERFAPQDPGGGLDRERGLRQFIVGTGGVELRDFEAPVANSELRLAVGHGVIVFRLGDSSYEWEWRPVAGEVADRGQASCH